MNAQHQVTAVVGLGRMGAAMARRLAGAGHRLILWNRDRGKAEGVSADTGGQIEPTPAAAASAADVVITSLADDEAVMSVYLGDDGIASGAGRGTLVLDTSTVSPATVRKVGAALDANGADFLDCPVSGSVSTVETGAITVMAGGGPDLVARAEQVLSAFAKKVVHTGDVGTGAATKLAVNSLLHGLNIALSEALVLAERAGVDREIAYEVFLSGAAGAPFVAYKEDSYLEPDTTPVAFSLDLVEKDLALITQLGAEVGARLDQANVDLEIVRGAVRAGMGDRDLSAIAVYLRGGL